MIQCFMGSFVDVLKVWRGDESVTLGKACELNTKHGHELRTMRQRRASKTEQATPTERRKRREPVATVRNTYCFASE